MFTNKKTVSTNRPLIIISQRKGELSLHWYSISTLSITHSKGSKKKEQKKLHTIDMKTKYGTFRAICWLYRNKGNLTVGFDHSFLLSSHFPDVHDQPLAVVPMVNGLHIHHCSLDPGFILSKKTKKQ